MKILSVAGFIALSISLAGYASAADDTAKDTDAIANLSVVTDPVGATCVAETEKGTVGAIAATPGLISVAKNMTTLRIACYKPGYSGSTFRYQGGGIGALGSNYVVRMKFVSLPS